MGVMVQIRDVPEEMHRKLKARAAVASMSLSDYLLAESARAAKTPGWAEMRARLEQLPPVLLPDGVDVVDVIREGREERGAELEARLR